MTTKPVDISTVEKPSQDEQEKVAWRLRGAYPPATFSAGRHDDHGPCGTINPAAAGAINEG